MKSRSQASRGLTKNAKGETPYMRLRRQQNDLCALCERLLRFNRANLSNSAIANHDPPFRTTKNANRPPNQLICKSCNVLKQQKNRQTYPQRRPSSSKASTSRATTSATPKIAKNRRTKKGKLIVDKNNRSERANYFKAIRSFKSLCERCGKELNNKNVYTKFMCSRCESVF